MILISDLHFGTFAADAQEQVLKACIKDGLVVISGDLTYKSKPNSFMEAQAFIKKLRDNDVCVVLTTGNHDFGGSVAEAASRVVGLRSIHTGYATARANLLQLFQNNIFYQEQVFAFNKEELDTIVVARSCIFVALRSQHRKMPRIKSNQIDWAVNELKKVEDISTYALHFVTHHSLWQDASDKHKPLGNQKELEQKLLAPFGFSSYIHGHNHRFTLQETHTPKTNTKILRIGVPTVSERSRDFDTGYLKWKGNRPKLVMIEVSPESDEEEEALLDAPADSDREILDLS